MNNATTLSHGKATPNANTLPRHVIITYRDERGNDQVDRLPSNTDPKLEVLRSDAHVSVLIQLQPTASYA